MENKFQLSPFHTHRSTGCLPSGCYTIWFTKWKETILCKKCNSCIYIFVVHCPGYNSEKHTRHPEDSRLLTKQTLLPPLPSSLALFPLSKLGKILHRLFGREGAAVTVCCWIKNRKKKLWIRLSNSIHWKILKLRNTTCILTIVLLIYQK